MTLTEDQAKALVLERDRLATLQRAAFSKKLSAEREYEEATFAFNKVATAITALKVAGLFPLSDAEKAEAARTADSEARALSYVYGTETASTRLS